MAQEILPELLAHVGPFDLLFSFCVLRAALLVPPCLLEGSQGLVDDRPHAFRAVGLQQVEHHGKVDPDLAHDGIRRRAQPLVDQLGILVRPGYHQRKAHLVLSPPARPADHLLQVRCGKGLKLFSVVAVALNQDHGAGREVNPAGHG